MDAFFSFLPIGFVIALMTGRKNVPSFIALPLAAVVMYFFRFTYFGTETLLLNAGIVQGILTALTPILVIWGAVFLFRLMELSGAMKTIRDWLSSIAENKIEQVMIVGWAFAFLVEGASGFGTPVALAAPLLVGFGFAPLRAVILCLILNSVPVSFGAVGTPTWFGLGNLELGGDEILAIGQQTAMIHFIAGLVIPFIALRVLFEWNEIRANKGFILLSILSCTVPYLLLAQWNVEFPSLIGGAVGLLLTAFFARFNIGVVHSAKKPVLPISGKKLWKAFFPIGATIVCLILTRVDALGVKSLLNGTQILSEFEWGSWGQLWISRSLVVGWNGIFGTDLHWSHALLYVPSILPFAFVGVLSFWVLSIKKCIQWKIISTSFERMKKPIFALIGIMIFVKLMMVGGAGSPAMILGNFLAEISGKSWTAVAPLLGALGAFFSGSNTVSNLTFGGVQMAAAQSLALPKITILALQNVGGAMGNMVSLQNIVAGCSVLGLVRREGEILLQTIKPLFWYAVIAGGMGLLLI
ncbi:L-lactate permease [Candidatus Gracilibacteria bacterium]|nr:L-lactate permease [Candidatus Gracilibacteria bacterium]